MTYNNTGISRSTKAIALGYDEDKDLAPKILASGNNLVADQILYIAKIHNIPVHRDADLVKILSLLEINSYIPVEIYEIVAKIISYVYEKGK